MVLHNFHSMNFIAVLPADIIDDKFAILFNLSFIEDLVSILWHQYDVVGNLTIAMAEAAQLQDGRAKRNPPKTSIQYQDG